ncbi:hypothetical protein Z517_04842 [Fonsecaea pedrosoi CBS 271.37]|uniref:DUF6594 domain-containing protein n=1 Tax=Fonsecaea pedrosoi CBS 271.37 TaxID=1442368 RepID=A0A0D2DVE1_9EURO|nr:uncharacterized protein Z517_04842 [Fonsecaea pedrosoi CBS 271.37]KIW81816.1 hypothetical protein Z517_04842 [Fonsecaea pedrosoi CBS 271.37]
MEGYTKIASFMGKHPESAQVLRFSDLNLQNILYLQAEIYGLREDLRKIEAQTQNAPSDDLNDFALDWFTLASTQDENGRVNQQWQKFLQLRPLLKEYNEAVIQYHQMSEMPKPSTNDLAGLQEWLRRPSLGAIYLTGRDREVWSQGTDLVAIADRPRSNRLRIWIADSLVPTLHIAASQRTIRGGNSEFGTNFAEYSDTAITQAANLLGTVLASLLPVVAIIVLYLIEGIGIRLGLVAVFSALFSTCLWVLNDGRLIEVFSATSA